MKNYYTLLISLFFQISFGQIGFQDRIIIDQSFSAEGVVEIDFGDIDGDGDKDLIASLGEDANEIIWRENLDGLGTFGVQNIVGSFDAPDILEVADLDGDGDLDVATSSYSNNSIVWFENLDGQGTFGLEQLVSNELYYIRDFRLIDIDDDGDFDIFSASHTHLIEGQNKLVWFENIDGFGTFSAEQLVTDSDIRHSIVYGGDIDNDGDKDIISLAFQDDTIAWYENLDGQGDFGDQQIVSDNSDAVFSVVLEDMDNDSDLDIVSTYYSADKIVWFENINGLGEFGDEQIIANMDQPNNIMVGDVDNDSDLDVIIGNTNNNGIIGWFENTNSEGVFSDIQIIAENIYNLGYNFVTDIDDDGDLDFFYASYQDNKIAWFENLNGAGDFSTEINLTSRVDIPEAVYSADLDGDGDLDVLSASSGDDKLAWYENMDGLGDFGLQKVISDEAYQASALHAADFDGDGDLDVVFSSYLHSGNNSKLTWFENLDGLGNFSEGNSITTTLSTPKSVVAGDVDGDGDMDVISCSFNTSAVVWYDNLDGLGTFSSSNLISSNVGGASCVFVADMDNDGDLDVLSTAQLANRVLYHENLDGLGDFTTAVVTYGASGASSVSAADFDGDGDLDILRTSFNDDEIMWHEYDEEFEVFNVGDQVTFDADYVLSAYPVDIDNDGHIDIVAAESNNNEITWYRNEDGEGGFGEKQIVSLVGEGPASVFVSDIDNDGDIDIISASRLNDMIAWHENLGISTNEINGNVLLNLNDNGCDLVNGSVASNLLVVSDNSISSISTFTDTNGFFQMLTSEGTYNTSVVSDVLSQYSISPQFHQSDFIEYGNTNSIEFCLESIIIANDLNITIYPSINEPRPGFDTTYQLVYNNRGTTQLSGSVSFEFDETKLQFLNASETVSSQTSNLLTFDYTDLNPFETRTIDLEFNVFTPPTTEIGDELISTATINPVSGDETEDDNIFELQQTVIGSFDPNDIKCLEGEEILIEDADKYLHYLIRFQNTGTASAINVRVENVLDDKLDWTTMQLESLSHTGRVEILNGSDVSFLFDNINLPDSTNDEPSSHGFIAYKIKPKDDVVLGDVFYNTAEIYFDFNPPIITNTVSTEIVDDLLSVTEFEDEMFTVYPNPTNSIIYLTTQVVDGQLIIYDNLGKLLMEFDSVPREIDIASFESGLYLFQLKSENKVFQQKIIKF